MTICALLTLIRQTQNIYRLMLHWAMESPQLSPKSSPRPEPILGPHCTACKTGDTVEADVVT